MMGWAGEKAFDFTLPNRRIVYWYRANVRSIFDCHDKKSCPALCLSTEPDGGECGGHRNQYRTAASKSLHHGTPYSGTRNWPETRPLRELVIICTPIIHCRGNRNPFQNKIINPTSPLFTQTTTHSPSFQDYTAHGQRILTTSLPTLQHTKTHAARSS